MDYIKDLKIALINADMSKIEELSEIAFESNDADKLQEAAAIVGEVVRLLDSERAKALEGMRNIQKMKQYMLENKKDLL